MSNLSKRPKEIPCGDYILVTLIVYISLFVAKITIGAKGDSKFLVKYIRHSILSILRII